MGDVTDLPRCSCSFFGSHNWLGARNAAKVAKLHERVLEGIKTFTPESLVDAFAAWTRLSDHSYVHDEGTPALSFVGFDEFVVEHPWVDNEPLRKFIDCLVAAERSAADFAVARSEG